MDIEGLGEKMIEFLYEKSYIRSIPDIYDLKNKRSELETLDGLGKKSVTIILDGIEKSKEKDLKFLLPSLSFTDIGHKVTEILIESGYTDIELMISVVKDLNGRDKLSSLFGLGEKTIQSLFRELNDPNNISLISDLKERGLNFQSEKVKKSNNLIFLNQIWCVTGTFNNFNPREKALEIIEYYGGKKTTTVSSKTTHLLVGDGGGSKLEKANKFGVTLVTENEFLKLLKSGGYIESVF
jgi:DNA ligase (NAD+)